MKRITGLLLIMTTSLLVANAQQYSIGFKPSFLIIGAKYTEDPLLMGLKLSPRISYGFGFTFTDQINRIIDFKLEPRFIAKGYKVDWSPDADDIWINNYISMPVLISISPFKNFSLEVGPDICYRLSSGGKSSGSKSFKKNDSQYLREVELSIVTGICYSFLNRFDLGARYGFGLSPSEKGTLMISDWDGTQIEYKFVQSYLEFYLNTKFIIKQKKN
jgi:hypothetical protein